MLDCLSSSQQTQRYCCVQAIEHMIFDAQITYGCHVLRNATTLCYILHTTHSAIEYWHVLGAIIWLVQYWTDIHN
jgi:hypothetical protein